MHSIEKLMEKSNKKNLVAASSPSTMNVTSESLGLFTYSAPKYTYRHATINNDIQEQKI